MAEADPHIVPKADVATLTPAFAVRLASILRVKPFISREETRYYLNGVHVEACSKGGVICVATDGHRLGAQRDPDGYSVRPVTVRLPNEIKLPTAAEMKRNPRGPWLVCMEASGRGNLSVVPGLMHSDADTPECAIERVEEASLRIGQAVIDGGFPDWRRVMPQPAKDAVTRTFNPQYIKDFGTTATFTGNGEMDPHLVRTADREFIGVIMPIRVITGSMPDWLVTA